MSFTEAQYQAQVMVDLGDTGANAMFTLVFPAASTAGTWTFTLSGATSGAINRFDTLANIQAAIQAVSSIGSGNAIITLGANGYNVEFVSALGMQIIPTPTVDGSNLSPAGTVGVVPLVTGASQYLANSVAQKWTSYASGASEIANIQRRYLQVRYDCAVEMQGYVWGQVDTTTGEEKRSWSKQFDHITAIITRTQGEMLALGGDTPGTIPNATSVAKMTNLTPNGLPYGHICLPGCDGWWPGW